MASTQNIVKPINPCVTIIKIFLIAPSVSKYLLASNSEQN